MHRRSLGGLGGEGRTEWESGDVLGEKEWPPGEMLQGGPQGEGGTDRESGEVLGEIEWPPGEMVGGGRRGKVAR